MLQKGKMVWEPYQKGPIPVDFIGGLVFQAKRRVPQAGKLITDPTRYKGKKNRSWVRQEEEDFFFFFPGEVTGSREGRMIYKIPWKAEA